MRATAASTVLAAPGVLASPIADASVPDPIMALGERQADVLHRIQTERDSPIWETLFDELDEVEDQIAAAEPTTLPGALVKLRTAVRGILVNHSDREGNVDYDAMEPEERVTVDVLRDLKRLVGGAT